MKSFFLPPKNFCDRERKGSRRDIYLVKVVGAASALTGGVVVDIGLDALLGIALLDVDFGIVAGHLKKVGRRDMPH